jgi:pSer/pThr/pTyr-binding forkhead associated (FHA) protein
MAVLIQFANGAPGIKFELDKSLFRIGRSLDNDLCIPDGFVSKAHAVIERKPSERLDGSFDYFISDLKSTNKTYVNDAQVSRFRLHDDDVVRIGNNRFRFVLETEDSSMDADPSSSGSNVHRLSRRLQVGGH